jgi:ATP-binding cassette subfamily C protein LapB
MNPTTEPEDRSLAAWMAAPMWANRGLYVRVVVAATMINLFGLASSLFAMTVYDRVLPNNALASLVGLSIGLALVVVFDFLLRGLRAYFVDIAGANIDREIGEHMFGRLLAMRLALRRGSTGQLTGLMRELESLRDFFASATLSALVDVPFILLTLAIIAAIGGWVVLVPLAAVPIVVGSALLTRPTLERLAGKAMAEGLTKQAVLVETVGGIETVKANGAGPLLALRWIGAIDRQADHALRQRMVSAIGMNVVAAANTLSYAGVVIFGVTLIVDHKLTMGALVACSMLTSRAVSPLAQIAQLLSRLTATRAAYRQLDAFMRQPLEGPEGQGLRPGRIAGSIALRHVSFTYPGAAEPALRDVAFSIAPGERVALIGRVGSGKSTIARLLLGLHEAGEGLIQIDGTDIRQFDPVALRLQIGAALQESVLLSGSVRENIVLGRPDIDEEEMLRAARISGTHDHIGSIANGYDLKLTDRGEGLSGGQRQSIALARALAGRPSLMIFDEPTSAMDGPGEAQLIDRLMEEVAGRTMILITHRPALVRLATRVIVMEAGRVIVDGPRDEVLARQRAAAAGAGSGPRDVAAA